MLVIESWLIVVLDLAKKARTVVFALQSYTTFNVKASSVVNCGLTRDYEFSICCISGKHTASSRKSKKWLARNQGNVPSGETCIHVDCCFIELLQ